MYGMEGIDTMRDDLKGNRKKSFIEWFDPHNLDHINAYIHLKKTGHWPEGFVPDDVEMESYWIAGICAKMADAWVECVRYKTSF